MGSTPAAFTIRRAQDKALGLLMVNQLRKKTLLKASATNGALSLSKGISLIDQQFTIPL